MENYKTQWSQDVALEAMRKWCAAQDRCQSEVRNKLIEHKVFGLDLENIIAQLITEGFINEERFAKNYVRGKFRMNHWGRIKIMQGLKLFQISEYCIRKGFMEIDYAEYYSTVKRELEKKWATLKSGKTMAHRKKLQNFGLQKGYESEIIREVINTLFKG